MLKRMETKQKSCETFTSQMENKKTKLKNGKQGEEDFWEMSSYLCM